MNPPFCTLALTISTIILTLCPSLIHASESDNWQVTHPEWLWCDGFESGNALTVDYQDVSTNGMSVVTGEAFEGTHTLRQSYTQGQVDAGWVCRVNNSGFPDHLFMRWYHKFETGFQGFPPKMARIRNRVRSGDWSSPYAVHCWLETDGVLAMDVSATNSTQANSAGWLSIARSAFTFADAKNIGRWICFEMEMKLNTPGSTDGLYRLWADDSLIAERTNVDLRGSTTGKINEAMLDCYWNGGSPKVQSRYYDNLVISTQKIGPVAGAAVYRNNRKTFSQAGVVPRCSIILANSRYPLISGKQIFDIRGRRLLRDQIQTDGIIITVIR